MDAKKYLSRAYSINGVLKVKEERLKEAKDTVPYSGPLYGDVKIDTNMKGSSVEYLAVRIAVLEDEIKELKEELKIVLKSTSLTIRKLSNPDMEAILEMRYLSFMDWEEIISRMGYSRGYVFKLHSQALAKIKLLL